MELKALQKAIHDAAMAVRNGDKSQWDKLKELRKQHRAAYGIPEVEPAKPAATPAPAPAAEKQKQSRKSKKDEEDKAE